jgi:hypothetical protein
MLIGPKPDTFEKLEFLSRDSQFQSPLRLVNITSEERYEFFGFGK